jgi:hypothetical protein
MSHARPSPRFFPKSGRKGYAKVGATLPWQTNQDAVLVLSRYVNILPSSRQFGVLSPRLSVEIESVVVAVH